MVADRSDGLRWRVAIAVMFIPAMLFPVLSARISSDTYLDEALALQNQHPTAGIIMRYVTWAVLLALLGMLLPRLRYVRLARPGFALFGVAIVYCAAVIVSALFALVPHVTATMLIVPLALTLVFVLPPIDPGLFLRWCSRGILLIAYGSVAGMIVAPAWALDLRYYDGLIPGFTVRLHGLSTHANALAPLLLVFLLADLAQPSRRWYAWVNRVVVLSCLVLTQSKTVWLLALVGWIVHLIWAPWTRNPLRRALVLTAVAALVVACVFYLYATPAFVTLPWEHESVRTLTGRLQIWSATMDVWRRNPFFGYGPDLWNPNMTLQYLSLLGPAAAHAHNQWIQTLGESGLVGVVPLGVYSATLLAYAVRYSRAAGGVALSWTVVFLLRTLTETPVRASVGDGTFQIQFMLVALLIVCARRYPARYGQEEKPNHDSPYPLRNSRVRIANGVFGISGAGRGFMGPAP